MGNIKIPIVYNLLPQYNFILYNYGDECTSITGGWVAPELFSYSGYPAQFGSGKSFLLMDNKHGSLGRSIRTKNPDNLYLEIYTQNINYCALASFHTVNKIDVTPFTTAKLTIQNNSTAGGAKDLVFMDQIMSHSATTEDTENVWDGYIKKSFYNKNGEIELDISDVSGEYYIGLINQTYGGDPDMGGNTISYSTYRIELI